MTKTYRNLWPEVMSWRNLLAAYRKCRRRKRHKPEAVQFDFLWESNLLRLQRELATDNYVPGEYHHFYIHDPKTRRISAAPFRDRVVHHAVVNVLEPLFERRFIFDSYACRRGKGTHLALNRTQAFLRKYPYYLKTDIVRFFPNVDHEILISTIERCVADPALLNLIRKILDSGNGVLTEEATRRYFPGDDLLALLRPSGLPIGNLTSQFFANVLLDPIDHFVKDELGVPGYVRYADDLVLFAKSKSILWNYRNCLAERLSSIRLRMHDNKTQIGRSEQGLKYLGLKLFRDGRRLQQASLKRLNRRLRRQRKLREAERIGFPAIRCSLRAWLTHARQANSFGVIREISRRFVF